MDRITSFSSQSINILALYCENSFSIEPSLHLVDPYLLSLMGPRIYYLMLWIYSKSCGYTTFLRLKMLWIYSIYRMTIEQTIEYTTKQTMEYTGCPKKKSSLGMQYNSNLEEFEQSKYGYFGVIIIVSTIENSILFVGIDMRLQV